MSFPSEPDVQVCRFGRGVRDDQCQEGNGNTWYGPSCCFAVSISGESCPPLWKRVCTAGEKMMSCTTGHPMSAVPTTCSPMRVAWLRSGFLPFFLDCPSQDTLEKPEASRVTVGFALGCGPGVCKGSVSYPVVGDLLQECCPEG